MALNNEQIICKLLKDEWSALKNMLEAEARLLRKIYTKINALTRRMINTVIRRVVASIKELFKMLEDVMGLGALSNNQFREKWCQVMYKCQPMIKKLVAYLGEDFFTWLYGPDEVKTLDLEYYGMPKQTFSSKYEVYEYYACRLSLKGLLTNMSEELIKNVVEKLNETLQYLDTAYWLNRTGAGKKILYYIKWYESIFNRMKPYIEEIDSYIDCSFALCDFAASSQNFLDDFCSRYSIGVEKVDIGGIPKRNYSVIPEDLVKDLNDHTKELIHEFDQYNAAGKKLTENTEALMGVKKTKKISNESLGETSQERETKAYDREKRTGISTPSLATSFNVSDRRMTKTILSPNSGNIA